MTTVGSAFSEGRSARAGEGRQRSRHEAAPTGPGQGYLRHTRLNQRQRLERRRLIREELLAVLVLVIALAVTLVLLGLQWLGQSAPSVSSAPPPAPASIISRGAA